MSQEEFINDFRPVVRQYADNLVEFAVELAELEINEGWRCFRARDVWLKEHLPAPLVNTTAKAYWREMLLRSLHRDAGQARSTYHSEFLDTFTATTSGYRNYLDVGGLDIESELYREEALDQVANEVTRRYLETSHRHFKYEIEQNETRWLIEAGAQGTLTPPYILVEGDRATPTRDESVELAYDSRYWRALYWHEYDIASDPASFMKPAWILSLMEQLAPDFAYAKALSTATRLIFLNERVGAPQWAISFSKIGHVFVLDPVLMLLAPGPLKRWRDDQVYFINAFRIRECPMLCARGLEIFLRYVLARFRRLIAHYDPLVSLATPGNA